jgi:uncharacterized circularly permuted ATP-grasp superfamily protein
MSIRWKDYKVAGLYDELMLGGGRPRDAARGICRYLASLKPDELQERKAAIDLAIQVMGITFTVYNQEGGSIDRAWPFDPIPRVIAKSEWLGIEAGLMQRVTALNMFIDDIYHEQRIIKDGIFPKEILASSGNFRKQCMGVSPAMGVWAHICGSDLVRDKDGTVYVLEDNLRVPSGVSYALENRMVMKRAFPELFETHNILPIDDYPSQLFHLATACGTSRSGGADTRHLQLRVLRACLSRPADGRRTRRGPRPGCRRG